MLLQDYISAGDQVLTMPTCRSLSLRCRAIASRLAQGIFTAPGYGVILFVLSMCLLPGTAQAQMARLSDNDLSGISGQAGLSINMDGSAQVRMDLLRFSDTQTTPNWIELHDVNVDNGVGGPFLFTTPIISPAALVTYFTAYYSALAAAETDPILKAEYEAKALYTWADNRTAILTDAKVLDGTIARVMDPTTIDVATNGDGQTYVRIRETSRINPRYYSIGSLVFNAHNATKTTVLLQNAVVAYIIANGAPAGLSTGFLDYDLTTWTAGDFVILDALDDPNIDPAIVAYQAGPVIVQNQPVGSIKLDALREGPSVYRLWAHAGQGISFDYTTTISADALTYAYNTTASGVLKFSNIHIAGSATGTSDDPSDPSTWEFGGTSNFFKIGTIGDVYNTPATIDVATDTTSKTSVYLNLPMAGTIRVGQIDFGGQNFGPIAIDGIQIHRLNLKIGGL